MRSGSFRNWSVVSRGPRRFRRKRELCPYRGNCGLFAGTGVALIGDASGSVDAITGEGLSLGFLQSVALARALKSGNLDQYRRRHAAIMRRPRFMQAVLLSLDVSGHVRRRALCALESHPDVFASLLSVHVGASPLLDLCSAKLLDLGFSFLAGVEIAVASQNLRKGSRCKLARILRSETRSYSARSSFACRTTSE